MLRCGWGWGKWRFMRNDMLLEARIELVGRSIRTLAERLGEMGCVFERPEAVLPGPEAETDRIIERLEREAGAFPLALKLFWRRIGSVNFCGSHPTWEIFPQYSGYVE